MKSRYESDPRIRGFPRIASGENGKLISDSERGENFLSSGIQYICFFLTYQFFKNVEINHLESATPHDGNFSFFFLTFKTRFYVSLFLCACVNNMDSWEVFRWFACRVVNGLFDLP